MIEDLIEIYEEIIICKNLYGYFPSVNNRKSSTKSGNRPKSIFFGYKNNRLYPNEKEYRGNARYPYLYNLLKEFAKKHLPNHKYNNILVNRSVQFLKHKDKGNVIDSKNIIVGIGDYEGGGLTVFDDNNNPTTYDIWCNPLEFNPYSFHQVEDFKGDRITITYYLRELKQ